MAKRYGANHVVSYYKNCKLDKVSAFYSSYIPGTLLCTMDR